MFSYLRPSHPLVSLFSSVIQMSHPTQMPWRSFLLNVPLACLSVGLLGVTSAMAQESRPWADPSSERLPSPTSTLPAARFSGEPLVFSQQDPYVLGPGDEIQIDVFNVPELSGSYTVLVDGALSIPWIGDIDIQGRTLREAADLLAQRYTPLLARPPRVTVTLRSPRPVRVVVAGEIRRPGSYTVGGSTDEAEVRGTALTQVIQLAGGVTQQADVHRVQIVRPSRFGIPTVMEVSLWDLIQSGNLDQDIPLRDGDRVMIFAAARSPEEDARIAAANFSPQDPRLIRVAVAGEIRRPGTYSKEVEPGEIGPTLTEIIRESGGITEQADVRRVQVIRPTPTGEPMVLESNLWDLIQSGDLGQDIRLRDGDRVIVSMATTSPEESLRIATSNFSPDNILVQVAGEVPRGGNIELPVNASLNQAILAAGGLDNPRARSSAVELVRLNRDGTVLRQTYAVDLAAPPNEETNPILRADDVVIVRRNVISRTTDWLNVLVAPFVGLSTFFRLFGL